MRVAVYYSNSDVRLEERPVPEIGPGELLVRVEASGICGSDVMEWYRLHKAPLILGHEVAGVVVQVGEGIEKHRVGDRVAVYHHVPCNTCHYCLNGHHTACDTFRHTHFDPGGFAEYIRVKAINVERGMYPLPDHVSFEEGAFIEPLACVVRGLRLARMQPGRTVLIVGSGITGQLMIQLARALGAGRIAATDVVDFRLEMARKSGADHAFSALEYAPDMLRQVNDGRLADLVVICTGALPAVQQALASAERGGTVLFFAPTKPGEMVSLDVNRLWADEVTVTMCYGGSPEDAMIAHQLICNGRMPVKDLITHRLSIAKAGLGFQLVAGARESMKVILEPHR